MRRWERNCARYVIEVAGQRVASVKICMEARVLADAGIEHCTRHDLRHTAITWAMQRGMPIKLASRPDSFGVQLWTCWSETYAHHHPGLPAKAPPKIMARKQ